MADRAVAVPLTPYQREVLALLAHARSRPAEEAGCLYYSASRKRFVLPEPDVPLADQGVAPHWGRPGGILPRAVENE